MNTLNDKMNNEIRVVELFSGIGAQAKALKNINLKHKILLTADWDIYSIISYAFIHNNKEMNNFFSKFKLEISNYSIGEKNELKETIIKKVESYSLSKDSKNEYKNFKSLSLEFLFLLEKALIVTNNKGNILKLTANDIPYHDILTYSFPCQDLSLQGLQKGLIKGKSSSLLWEVERIIKELHSQNKLPKYLLMENVKAIFSKKYIKNFEDWEKTLQKIGYINHKFILNAKYFDIPQNRERAFMLSEFNQNKFKYPLETEITKKKISNFLIEDENNNLYLKKEIKNIDEILKDKSKGKTKSHLKNYSTFQSENFVFFPKKSIAPTITATGALNRIKIFDEGKNKIRILSSKELWLLMGFDVKDFDKINSVDIIPDIYLRKQAGNSIVVPVLQKIFENVFIEKSSDFSNHFKIELKVESKESKYKYSGKAILIFEKNTHKLVFNTMILNENQEIIGASSNRYGSNYIIQGKILSFRNQSFKKDKENKKDKEAVKFDGSIKKLNELILKNGLTIKTVDAFITGSNSSGGLSNPIADPIRLILDDKEIEKISNIYEQEINIKKFLFFSLISNTRDKSNNSSFMKYYELKFNDIELFPFTFLLEKNLIYIKKKWKNISFSNEKVDEFWDIKTAFISQNYSIFKNNKYIDVSIIPENFFKDKPNYIKDSIMNSIETIEEDKDIEKLDRMLRYSWGKIIIHDMKKKKYTEDFINGYENFERAHIFNHSKMKQILNEKNSNEIKDKILNSFLSSSNYLLLDPNTHNDFDKGNITINNEGKLENQKLRPEEFKTKFHKKNIMSIYTNVLNLERKKLLELRNEWK